MAGSLQLDRESGEVRITDNRHLDRETRDSYVMTVEARDEAGAPDRSSVAPDLGYDWSGPIFLNIIINVCNFYYRGNVL